MSARSLLAVSDLHVDHPANREILEGIRPSSESDWLIVCGDVADQLDNVEWALRKLRERFETVIWVPGNHELLVYPNDSKDFRGEKRYDYLVNLSRRIGVVTPEDPYPIWDGPGGPVQLVPMFLLYDYTFGRNVAATRKEALQRAPQAGVVCVDEFLLQPDPYPTREAWCDARVRQTERRLCEADTDLPTVLINHFPLIPEPAQVLHRPEFAQWCGTVRTADWHRRFRAAAVVYGHLHIPRTTWQDGVRFEEVSLGYPRERRHFRRHPFEPRQILPEASHA